MGLMSGAGLLQNEYFSLKMLKKITKIFPL